MTMDEDYDHLFPSATPTGTFSYLCTPVLLKDQEAIGEQQQFQHDELSSISGSCINQCNKSITMEQSLSDQSGKEESTHGSVKWMSSKMRLMRKMMGSDQIFISKQRSEALREEPQPNYQESSSSNSNSNINNSSTGIIRVCSNCSTTKTPLWRSGPQGPKSLCNACGIRQMKARRAMKAAAAAAGGEIIPPSTPKKVQKKEKRSELILDRTVPFKKRFKISTASDAAQKQVRLDDHDNISLSKNLANFHQAFPQDEKDAAILLMALSCGLIHG